jgi:hypothetical protein
MSEDLCRLRNHLERIAEDLDGGGAQVDTALRKLQDQVEPYLAQGPRVQRLRNALARAAEDLPTARVLVDTALRQVQDQIEALLTQSPVGEEGSQG